MPGRGQLSPMKGDDCICSCLESVCAGSCSPSRPHVRPARRGWPSCRPQKVTSGVIRPGSRRVPGRRGGADGVRGGGATGETCDPCTAQKRRRSRCLGGDDATAAAAPVVSRRRTLGLPLSRNSHLAVSSRNPPLPTGDRRPPPCRRRTRAGRCRTLRSRRRRPLPRAAPRRRGLVSCACPQPRRCGASPLRKGWPTRSAASPRVLGSRVLRRGGGRGAGLGGGRHVDES